MQVKVLIFFFFFQEEDKQINSVNENRLSYLNVLWIEPALSRDFRDAFNPRLFSDSIIVLLMSKSLLAVTHWAYIFVKGWIQIINSSCGNTKIGFIKLSIRITLSSRTRALLREDSVTSKSVAPRIFAEFVCRFALSQMFSMLLFFTPCFPNLSSFISFQGLPETPMSFAKKENVFICGLQQPFVVDGTFLFTLHSVLKKGRF